MRTKNGIRIILLFIIICLSACRDMEDPEEFMYGKWKINSLDSCVRILYPGTTLEEYRLQTNQGVFYFHRNGKCEIKNIQREPLFYIGNEYQWERTKNDSIHFYFNQGEVSHSAFILYNDDKVEFNIHVPRRGFDLWYRVVLKR